MERRTKQREAIREAIQEAHGPVSAREVLGLAQRRVRGMGIATVYRTLKALVTEREVVQVDLPGEPPRFEISGKAHHHHFYCRACSRMFEVEQCPGNFSDLAPPGFRLENHDLLLLGLCAACNAREPQPARTARAASGPLRPRLVEGGSAEPAHQCGPGCSHASHAAKSDHTHPAPSRAPRTRRRS